MRSSRATAAALLALGPTVAVAGCGGGAAATTHRTTSPHATAGHNKPGLNATLVGENHHPVAGRHWTYIVTAADAQGRPLSGTVETAFAFAGQVVGRESPPTHKLKHGRLRDSVTFPAAAEGKPIELQVVVRTALGSKTLDWPVNVVKR